MKKMIRILASAFCVVALLLGATACGSGGGSGGGSDQPKLDAKSNYQSPPDCIWQLNGTADFKKDIGKDQGMPGYYEIIHMDFQFDKLTGRYPAGEYRGNIYLDLKVDADEAIKQMLANIPQGMAQINFDASAYGLRNDIPFTVTGFDLYQKQRNIWPNTEDGTGKDVKPAKDDYVAEGTVALPAKSKVTAGGSGNTGGGSFKIGDITLGGDSTEDIQVRFVIEPDSVWGDSLYTSSTGSRKVKIYVRVGKDWFTGDGTLTRQPGGLVNQNKYNENPPQSLSEKYGVEATAN
jgi:hypothetical protein